MASYGNVLPSTIHIPFTNYRIKPRELWKNAYQENVRRNIKLIIFDLDDTLIDVNGVPFDDAERILKWAKRSGYKVAMASYNRSAKKIVNELGWRKYFDYISEFGPTDTKKVHLYDIMKAMGASPVTSIFIDDRRDNIQHAREFGVHTLLVDPEYGANFDTVVNVIMG